MWGAGGSQVGIDTCPPITFPPPPSPAPAGFSVDSGAGLTRQQELSFVTGAPRANHTGAVVILRRDGANRLVPEAVLPGQQLTSAFGYAVAVLDLNSDG